MFSRFHWSSITIFLRKSLRFLIFQYLCMTFAGIARITSIALVDQVALEGRVLPSTFVSYCSPEVLFLISSRLQFVTVDDVRILRDIGMCSSPHSHCFAS